uniref:NEDD4 binding protein 2 like 2 n=2 Tax=Lepisosteus oculatus TaxID=7918 RepID=W5MNM8_LEPOC
MNSYYDYSRNDGSWQWEGREFPSASGYDGQDVYYDGSQRFVGSACRPHGYRNYPSSNGNGFSYCGEEAWSHPPEPGASDGFQSGQRQEERYPGPEYDGHSESSPVLILMRGLPGSGKSTRAQELLSSGPEGIVLSTDDYFSKEKGYTYDSALLGEAHDWNHNRAREALDQGRSPVIIDNTNLQAWEMKPYVELALERGYRVEFQEPDTSWKSDPLELEKRNKHGVPGEKISHMLERFERPVSVDIVLNSQEPTH